MAPLKIVLRVLVVLAILVASAFVVFVLIQLRPKADKVKPAPLTTTVEVMEARSGGRPVHVAATGVVEPARQATLSPEVGGRIVWQAKGLVAGGLLKKGQTLIKVDDRDYQLAVEQQQSMVEQARLALEVEKSQQGVAQKEWKLLSNPNVKASPLALRVPQVKTAEVALSSAESALSRSKLALERTTVRVPFDAMVVSEQVEVGQLAMPSAPVATVIGTERFWVVAQVPVEKLVHLKLAGDGKAEDGSPVLVVQDLGSQGRLVKKGRVLRLKSSLDPGTRTAAVVIGVDDPLSLDPAVIGSLPLPLLPRAFVNVDIEGAALSDVTAVPRKALVDGDRVWTVDADERLRSTPITIGWRTPELVFVTGGLANGTRVVASPVATPVEGMKVKISRVIDPDDVRAMAGEAQDGP